MGDGSTAGFPDIHLDMCMISYVSSFKEKHM